MGSSGINANHGRNANVFKKVNTRTLLLKKSQSAKIAMNLRIVRISKMPHVIQIESTLKNQPLEIAQTVQSLVMGPKREPGDLTAWPDLFLVSKCLENSWLIPG